MKNRIIFIIVSKFLICFNLYAQNLFRDYVGYDGKPYQCFELDNEESYPGGINLICSPAGIQSSPLLPGGWSIPVLCACVKKINETTIVVSTPDSQVIELHKNKTNGNYENKSGKWTGRVDGHKFILKNSESKEVCSYTDGYIEFWKKRGQEVMNWQRNSKSIAVTLGNESKRPLLSANFNEFGALKAIDTKNGGSIVFDYTFKDGIYPVLEKITKNKDVVIDVEMDKLNSVGESKYKIKYLNYQPVQLVWNNSSGLVKSVNDWHYEINSDSKKLSIRGHNKKSDVVESYEQDFVRNICTQLKNGIITRTYYIPVNMGSKLQCRKIESEENGVKKILKTCYYDAQGRLLRENDYVNKTSRKIIYNNDHTYVDEYYEDGVLVKSTSFIKGKCASIHFSNGLKIINN